MTALASGDKGAGMGKFLAIVGGFIGGFVAGWSAALLVYIFYTDVLGHFDRDGGGAMGTAFVIGPFLGIIVGTIAAIYVSRRQARKPIV